MRARGNVLYSAGNEHAVSNEINNETRCLTAVSRGGSLSLAVALKTITTNILRAVLTFSHFFVPVKLLISYFNTGVSTVYLLKGIFCC